jgi:hypothetical protein
MPHTDIDAAISADLIDKSLRDELHGAPIEPLLPIEKKLIGWSLGLGLVLLLVLAAANHFFPATL